MNKERRKSIDDIIARLKVAKELIIVLVEEEQESLDNLPDNLQESTRAERMQEAIENLEYAIDSIEETITNLQDAQNC